MPIPTPPSPKTNPTRRVSPIVWAGFTGIRGGQRVITEEFDNYLYRSHSATIATPSHCGSSARWGKRQQSTVMVVMDIATATRQQWQWTARRQCNGNVTAAAVARQWRAPRQRHRQREGGVGSAVAALAAAAAAQLRQAAGWQGSGGGGSTGTTAAARQRWWQCGGSAVAAAAAAAAARRQRWQQWGRWRRWRQRGSGNQLGSLAAALRQRGGRASSLAVAPRQEVRAAQRWRGWQCVGGGGQCIGSVMEADIAAAAAPTAVLPPVEVKITIVVATNKQ
jgi:hypothetical protein